MKKIAIIYLFCFLLTGMGITSCHINHDEKISVQRFEQQLFSMSPDSLPIGFPKLVSQNTAFTSVFCEYIIGIGPTDHPNIISYLNQFIEDPVIREVFDQTNTLYQSFDEPSVEIAKAINEFNQLIRQNPISRITTFISGFNQSFVTLDHQIAIGLDNYLGSDSRFYRQLGLPEYIIQYRNPDQIVPDAVRAWITSELQTEDAPKNLLSKMISEGLIYFAATKVLPERYHNPLFRYTDEQWEWCLANEKAIWTFLIDQELLFSTDQLMIRRLTEEAPFTREFGNESPPRIGSWMGYRILEQLTKKKKWSIDQIRSVQDPESLLAQSGYRPR